MSKSHARLRSTYRAARRNLARAFVRAGLEKSWPNAWLRAASNTNREMLSLKPLALAAREKAAIVATADVQAEAVKVEPTVRVLLADEVDPSPLAAATATALKKPRARKPAAPKPETPKAPRKAAAKAPKPDAATKAPAAPRKRVAKAKAA